MIARKWRAPLQRYDPKISSILVPFNATFWASRSCRPTWGSGCQIQRGCPPGCTLNIALKDIDAPMFVIATEADHIAPWRSVYKTRLFTDCDLTFVLTSGGHNSGIINEPGSTKGQYNISHHADAAHYVGPDGWLKNQTARPGSWWPEWNDWLHEKSSGLVTASATEFSGPNDAPVITAPGAYIYQT